MGQEAATGLPIGRLGGLEARRNHRVVPAISYRKRGSQSREGDYLLLSTYVFDLPCVAILLEDDVDRVGLGWLNLAANRAGHRLRAADLRGVS